MANRNLNTPADVTAAVLKESMGGCGATYTSSSDASGVDGKFAAVTILTDGGTIAITGSPAISAANIGAGITIFGKITNVTCTGATTAVVYKSCR